MPWTVRDRKYLLKKRYQYRIDGGSKFDFPNLLQVSGNSVSFTEPSLYLSVVIPAMNEEVYSIFF